MDKVELNKIVNKYFKLYLSIFTIVIGILFIWQTGDIYFTGKEVGEQMYTYAIIGAHFQTICIPVYIYLASIIAGIVIHFVFPLPKKRTLPKKEFKDVYNLYVSKREIDTSSNKEVDNGLKKLHIGRLVSFIITLVICLACLVMTCCFVFNFSFYSKEGNLIQEMVNVVIHILPWVVICFAVVVSYLYYRNYNYKKSFELVKKASSTMKKSAPKEDNRNKIIKFFDKYGVLITRIVVGCVAVTFIILGIWNKGYEDVLNKAINICTECIGLG